MQYSQFISAIRFALKSHEAERAIPSYPSLRPAAVMILLFPDASGRLATVLMRRAVYEGQHSNEISFPGGKYERTDCDLMATAVRETTEELGVSGIDVVAALTPVPVLSSGYLIHPFVGVLEAMPIFCVSGEVQYPVITQIDRLLPIGEKRTLTYLQQGQEIYESCYFLSAGETIIGPTAQILDEFLSVARSVQDQQSHQPQLRYQFMQL